MQWFEHDPTAYTPNGATWLFVLIHRYRTYGLNYREALNCAREHVKCTTP